MREALKQILSKRDNREGIHIQSIVDALIMSYPDIQGELTREKLLEKVNKFLLKQSKDKKGEFAKVRKGVYRFIKRRTADPLPQPIREDSTATQSPQIDTPHPSTNYIGKGGEYAVMSELLFQGYNANIMTVDEGIDIVASKQNVFYYLQVKTTNLTERLTANVNIKKSSFDRGLASQLRYFVVVRCGSGETRYFKFSEEDIIRYSSQGYILISEGLIHIKIRFGVEDHLPYLYHDNRTIEIRYHQNNFNL